MINHLNIVCYRWGSKYGSEYVNILRAMVERNLSVPHTFHCITDSPENMDERIAAHPLPNNGVTGIWRKLTSFEENFLGLQGQWVVVMDIDVVVVGSLDFLAEQPEKDFLIGRHWGPKMRSGKQRACGCVYRLKVGSHTFVWDRLIEDFEGAVNRYHGNNRNVGEQNWLNEQIDEFDYFPEGKIVSFKRHCRPKGRPVRIFGKELLNTARFKKAFIPPKAAVISFHGEPNPRDVKNSGHRHWPHAPFVKKHWCI